AHLPSHHPMHAGYDPAPWIADADLILVLDCAVPWIPDRTDVAHAPLVQVGAAPLHGNIPLRSFECDLAIAGSPAAALTGLRAELGNYLTTAASAIAARRVEVEGRIGQGREEARALVERVKHQTPIHPAWFSHCIDVAKGEDAILVKEAPQLTLAQQ